MRAGATARGGFGVASVLVLAWVAAAAACAPEPRAPQAFGEPVPSATTSAEPLWLRNRP